MNYLVEDFVEDFMEESKEPTLCHECAANLTVGQTEAEKKFLAAEKVSTEITHLGMRFKQGKGSSCGKEGEVIYY